MDTTHIKITQFDIEVGRSNRNRISPTVGCPIAVAMKVVFSDENAWWAYYLGFAGHSFHRVIGGEEENNRILNWVEHFDDTGEGEPIEFDIESYIPETHWNSGGKEK